MSGLPSKKKRFKEALKEVENSVKAGFKDNKWFPHKSLEGGNDTIAYGHKITGPEQRSNTILIYGEITYYKEGLTEEEAERLLDQDIKKHENIAENQWGAGFEDLPFKYRMVLVNIGFNVGSLVSRKTGKFQWPNLKKAMEVGDDTIVRKEMVTSYTTPEGKKVRLTERAETIADALGLEK